MSAFNEQVQEFTERFRQWPPVMRWGLFVALAIILYLLWDGTIAPQARQWEAQANSIQNQVRQIRDREAIAGQIRTLRETIVTMGEVREPLDIAAAGDALMRAVNEVVVDEFGATNYSVELRSSSPMRTGMLPELTRGADGMLATYHTRFETSPEDAIAIVAALESRPEVVAINRTHIQRIGGRRVEVRLWIDTWGIGGGAPVRRTV